MTSIRSHVPPPNSSTAPRSSPKRRKSRRLSRVEVRRIQAPTAPRTTIARYVDWRGQSREIIARSGCGGSVLVLDRDAATLEDRRLIAHLGADEPLENVAITSRCYLVHVTSRRYVCRAFSADDLTAIPFSESSEDQDHPTQTDAQPVEDSCGSRYRLTPIDTGMSIPELRWCREMRSGVAGTPVSVRSAISCVEAYEPIRALTRRALDRHRQDGSISVTVLRGELTRVRNSPIVLNRRLRAAVLAATEHRELSMSEIAMRGETSWLARRLGLLPEGGRTTPTPWIHSDVLGLIARNGLGVSPREVEVE
jgi:hypothetical protein